MEFQIPIENKESSVETKIEGKPKGKFDRKAYGKQYFKDNPKKWYDKRVCTECGHEYRLNNKTHHYKSKKHNYGIMKSKLEKYEMFKEFLKV